MPHMDQSLAVSCAREGDLRAANAPAPGGWGLSALVLRGVLGGAWLMPTPGLEVSRGDSGEQ